MYGVRLRLATSDTTPRDGKPLLRHARTDVGAFAVEDIELHADLEAAPDPLKVVVVPSAGWIAGQCDGIAGKKWGAGEVRLMSQPDQRRPMPRREPAPHVGVAGNRPWSRVWPRACRRARRRCRSASPVSSRWASGCGTNGSGDAKNCVLADDSLAAIRRYSAMRAGCCPLSHCRRSRTRAWLEPTPYDDRTTDSAAACHRAPRRQRRQSHGRRRRSRPRGAARGAVHVPPQLGHDTDVLLAPDRLHHAHQELVAGDRMRQTVTEIAARVGIRTGSVRGSLPRNLRPKPLRS